MLDGLLDGVERALVVGRDHQQAGLGNAEPGQLLERHLGPVVVDVQLLDQRRRGPPGPDAAEVGPGVVHRLAPSSPAASTSTIVDHGPLPAWRLIETSVPIRSPLEGTADVARLHQVEHHDGQLVVHAEGDGGGVHDLQALVEDLHVGDLVVAWWPRGRAWGRPCRRRRRPSGCPCRTALGVDLGGPQGRRWCRW